MNNDIAKKRERKITVQKRIMLISTFLYLMLCGGIGGILIANFTNDYKTSATIAILGLLLQLIVFYLGMFVNICIHECGHLLFGLLSGYKFQSIRFGSLMFCKVNGKIKISKYTLAGTGGQCLMIPPQVNEDELPTSLYNWGGVIMNMVLVIIFGITFFIAKNSPIVRFISVLFVLVGIFFIILNGIPFESMGNDGYNAVRLKRNLKSKHAFYIQLLIASELAKNHAVTDMPSEWFQWEYDENDDAMAMSQGVMRLNWLIYSKRIEEAYCLSEFLLEHASALVEIHQMMIQAEHLYCMIILNKDENEIKSEFMDKQKSFKALKKNPSIQRLLFVYYSVIEKDENKAREAKKNFEKIALTYPYPCEIMGERELMDMIL